MSDDRDLFEPGDDEAVLPGSGLPGPKRPASKPRPRRKESNDAAGNTPEAAPAAAVPSPPPPPAPAKRRGTGLFLLFPLLLLALAAYGGWQWYQRALEPALETVTENRDNLAQLGQRQQQVIGQQGELLDALKMQSNQDQLWQKAQEDKLVRLQARVSHLDRNARTQALLLESSILLRQADRLIRLERDLPAALSTLRLLDQLLMEIDDSGADYVRGILGNDLQHLADVASLDRQGIYLRLETLASGVDQWPILQQPRTEFQMPAASDAGASHWEQLQARLKNLVVIRPREIRDQPIMPPGESWLLHENLRLSLRQAAWAAVQAQPAVYGNALAQASGWIQRYFNTADPAVADAVKTLQTLQAVNVGIPVIDLAASQKALAAYRSELGTVSGEGGE